MNGRAPTGGSAFDALERLASRIRPLGRISIRLALLAAAGGVAVWVALLRALGEGSSVALSVAAVLLALPPVALALFALGVGALAALPAKLREAPSGLRERAQTIRRRAGEVASSRGRGLIGSLTAAGRLWWTIATSREIVEIVGPAAILLTPATFVAAIAGAVAAVLEVLAGLVALLWLALR